MSATRPRLRRALPERGSRDLRWQLYLAAYLGVSYVAGDWNITSTGLVTDVPPWTAFNVGLVSYFAISTVGGLVLHWTGEYGAQLDNSLQVIARVWPRSRAARCRFLTALCILNPVTEELLFRGILVHQLGIVTGSVGWAIAIGLAAHLCNHVYQGRSALFAHIPFYAIAVGLLYSRWGLVGAIGFHYAGDFWPFYTLKKQLRMYVDRHRQHRSAADASTANPSGRMSIPR